MSRLIAFTMLICACAGAACMRAATALNSASHSAAATTVATSTQTHINLASLQGARSVLIEDDWTGLSDVAPITAHGKLLPGPKEVTGEIVYSAAGYRMHANNTDRAVVTIPAEAWQQVLKQIADAQLIPGAYQPKIEHTDDYPSLRLSFSGPSGTIEIASTSQGESRAPLGVKLQGKSYTITGDKIAGALHTIDKYLHRDVQSALIERLRKNRQ